MEELKEERKASGVNHYKAMGLDGVSNNMLKRIANDLGISIGKK